MKKIKYYVWANEELLGTLEEINKSTALQKAKLISTFYKKNDWMVTLSDQLHEGVVAAGKVYQMPERIRSSKCNEIFQLLTMRKAN